jgi:hypothetical protein
VNVRPALLALVIALAACGGSQENRMPSSWANFDCKDRKVSYFVVGGMAAQESGVQVDCSVQGPRVMRWLVDKDGTRTEDSTNITPGEFEDLWKRIEGVGWRHLGDCAPDEGKDIPVYTFEVADWQDTHSFGCDALRPEFPWITLIDELDAQAARIQGNRGKAQVDVDDSDLEE